MLSCDDTHSIFLFQQIQELGSLSGLDAELRKFSGTVSSIQAVLLNAEEKQGSSHEVRDWITKLKTVFFEADDLLDDFATDVTHRKLVKNKVCIFFTKSNPLLYNLKISRRLKAIRENLDAIAKDMTVLNLVARQQPLLLEPNSAQVILDRETYSFIPEGEVIGRNDDKKIIVDLLLDSKVQENVAVVSIVGLPGLGKTALAQWVFNDQMVQRNFDKTLWVCVSDVFDVKLIAEKIIESANEDKADYLQLVQNKLRETLDGKKYLLVLDDVWNTDASKWSTLKNILISGAKGSKILVTTRSDVVADVSGSLKRHKLRDLPGEEAWALFRKMTFDCNTESENQNLVEIGKKIVKKCAGVPLAIRSVGSLLRLKRTEDEWLSFENQDLSSITRGGDNNVMAILRLSYNHLPQHIKQCFAYCSLFPKDFKIPRVDLVDMWIAQGFIQSTTTSSRDVEDNANSYFMDLLRRSFFQEADKLTCKMHDLIHDLAKEVADREFFSITKAEDTEIAPEQTLHASCLVEIDDSFPFQSPFYRNHKKLRTFIYLKDYGGMNVSTDQRMISSFKCLRVLDLHRQQIHFLPQSLGGLKHLRYLAISSDSIVTLPNSITKLHNLQVLKLNKCYTLKELPRDIWRLASLRRLECQECWSLTHIPRGLWQLASLLHLDFHDCFSLEDTPPGIGQLTSLRTLTRFVVGKENCISGLASDKLNELKGLVDLRGGMRIKFMGQVHAIGEKMATDVMKRMNHLQWLSVEFENGNNEDDTGAELKMLEALQPHHNIESLEINAFSGSRFPSWFMDENIGLFLPKLVDLSIVDCHKCKKLPPLWQLPSLQSLELWSLASVENIDGLEGDNLPPSTPRDEHYFPSLKELDLWRISEKIMKQILRPPHHPSPLCNLNKLTLWSVEGLETMPEDVFRSLTLLQSLNIAYCDNLVSLWTCLTHLTLLESLAIEDCPLLDLSNEEAFPRNLSTFRVLGLPKLMTIPALLRHVSATLKSIDIWNCPNLTTIPEWIGDLKALNWLVIDYCPKLTSLPEGMRSLTALQVLSIQECSSILKQRCNKESGEDWPKIAHIPSVGIRPTAN